MKIYINIPDNAKLFFKHDIPYLQVALSVKPHIVKYIGNSENHFISNNKNYYTIIKKLDSMSEAYIKHIYTNMLTKLQINIAQKEILHLNSKIKGKQLTLQF